MAGEILAPGDCDHALHLATALVLREAVARVGICGANGCTAFHVLAFPENQPATPGGFWSVDLGEVTTVSACLTILEQLAGRLRQCECKRTSTPQFTLDGEISPHAPREIATDRESKACPLRAWRA